MPALPFKSAHNSGDKTQARTYAMQLLEIAKDADTARPELVWARGYVAGK